MSSCLRSVATLYPSTIPSVSWAEEEDPGRKHKQEAFLDPWKFGFSDLMYNHLSSQSVFGDHQWSAWMTAIRKNKV